MGDADGVPQEEAIRLAGYNCENVCGRSSPGDPSPDFDYLFTIPKFVKRKQQFDYCCKGKLQPDWEALKARTLAMSAAENVRHWVGMVVCRVLPCSIFSFFDYYSP